MRAVPSPRGTNGSHGSWKRRGIGRLPTDLRPRSGEVSASAVSKLLTSRQPCAARRVLARSARLAGSDCGVSGAASVGCIGGAAVPCNAHLGRGRGVGGAAGSVCAQQSSPSGCLDRDGGVVRADAGFGAGYPHRPWFHGPLVACRAGVLGGIRGRWFALTTKQREWKRRLLTWALAACGLVGIVIVAAAVYSTATTVQVAVLNDETTELRLSGCVDDSNDIAPALTVQIDVPKRSSVGCNVSSFGTYKGCLILHGSRPDSERPARISRLLDPHINQAGCENIG